MEWNASGKLLLFGEYLVLKGAKALAIPLQFGQQMQVTPQSGKEIKWVANVLGDKWFSALFTTEGKLLETTDEAKALRLMHLFTLIKTQRPDLFEQGYSFQLNVNFPLEWGLGTSSTLVSLLAQWSETDPFYLLKSSFGGSGYDVACATSEVPILFEAPGNNSTQATLSLAITSKLLFIYSGKKQKSESEVVRFEKLILPTGAVEKMNQIVLSVLHSKEIAELEGLINQSETLLGNILDKEPVKNSTFRDYPFSIKSLGAWGGDFLMATFREESEARHYFNQKGYTVQFNYDQIIKKVNERSSK